jgi:hypothetical protein
MTYYFAGVCPYSRTKAILKAAGLQMSQYISRKSNLRF